MNSSSSSSLSPPSHSTRMTMILCVVGVIMMLYNTFIIMSHHHSSSPPTSQKHLNKHEAADDEYDRPAIDGQWLWDEWQRLSAHDKKAIFALVASVTQYDFQVCVGKFFSFVFVCVCADSITLFPPFIS
jgi:hypothetical protein